MHSLVPAVLLGTARLDAFDGDTEPHPPHGQSGQLKERIGAGEWYAVVGADGRRHAKLLENPFKYGESVAFLGGGKRFTGQKIAAGEIGDGQRIAVASVGEHELAFVIGAPKLVGRKGLGKGRPLCARS